MEKKMGKNWENTTNLETFVSCNKL